MFPKADIFFLFPAALVPLILFSVSSRSLPLKFLLSSAAGTLANIILLYWLYPTMRMNFVSPFSSALGLVLFSIYLGSYWGLFTVMISCSRSFGRIRFYIFVPACWVLTEYLKGIIFTGFPWLLIGYSMWKVPELLQPASITGVYGLSFIAVLFNTLIADSFMRQRVKPLAAGVLLFVILFGTGKSVINNMHAAADTRVAVLQGNISQYKKFDGRFKSEIMSIYTRLHKQAQDFSPDLVVWPETAAPEPLDADIQVYMQIQNMISETGASELVGTVEKKGRKYYNSAYMISPDGTLSEPYRKIHILPFGEYFPLRGIISRFADIVNDLGDLDRGNKLELLRAGDHYIATGICFESIFGGLIRKFFDNGAQIFVNITNDGWFMDTAGPYQHFVHSVIRAVENRTYVIRSANTGISAIIDPAGRILKKTGLLEEAVLTGYAGPSQGKTVYSEYGDYFVLICLVAAGVIMWEERKCLMRSKKN